MQLVLLEEENFGHSLPSSRFALFSSMVQLFSDWVSLSPAVAARSSLQVRATSKAGTPSAMVTTSCELKAIIEMEIGILLLPVLSGSARKLPSNVYPRAILIKQTGLASAKPNLGWKLSLSSHGFDFLYGIRAAG